MSNSESWRHPALREPVTCETKHRVYELVGPSEEAIANVNGGVSVDLRAAAAWGLARYLSAFPDPSQAFGVVRAAVDLLGIGEGDEI